MENQPTTYMSNETIQKVFDVLADMGAEQRKQTVRTDEDADRIMIVPIARAQEKLATRLAGTFGALAWQDKALCGQLPDVEKEYFHAPDIQKQRLAKAVCRACSVQAECLRSALDNREPESVWGGVSEKERKELIRRQSRSTYNARRGS